MKKEVSFLTDEEFDKPLLKKIIADKIRIVQKDDKKILQRILTDFEKNDFTLLSPQEIHFLNVNSAEKWGEYLIFRFKMLNFPKEKKIHDFPIYLLIEPVSACNLRCVMCFQIDKSFTSDSDFMGNMDLDLFKKTIDEAVKGGTKAVTLASRGEPTIHPHLGEMLEYCKGKFFELKINTNATFLNEKLIHQILKSGVTDMVFSVDSYTKKEYETIRVRGVFEEIFENIKNFKKIRDAQYPNSKCATRVSGVKFDKNQNTEKFKEFWQKYVDHVVMVEIENRWDTYHNPKEIMGQGACNYLWERMYVWYDGTCNPCDIDYKSELAVGSIKNQTIHEIWHGDKYSKLRNAHEIGKRNSCFPCDRCPVGS